MDRLALTHRRGVIWLNGLLLFDVSAASGLLDSLDQSFMAVLECRGPRKLDQFLQDCWLWGLGLMATVEMAIVAKPCKSDPNQRSR